MSRNMTRFNLKGFVVLLLSAALFMSSIFNTCDAKRGKHYASGREGISHRTETMSRSKSDHAESSSDDLNQGIVGGAARKHGKPTRKTNAHHSPKKSPSSSPTPGPIPYPPSPIPEPSPMPDPPSPTPSPRPSPPCPTPEPKPSPEPEPSPRYPPPPVPATVFNVLDFGGQGDGVFDDTEAFQLAWAAACKMAESTLLVPSPYKFLVGPISFSGPFCESGIVFQLDGTIIAPIGSKAWGSGLLQWIVFTKLKSITIRGSGMVEGRGSVWWGNIQTSAETVTTEKAIGMPHIKPTVLRFYGSYNVTVTGITIQNSPQCHLKFDACDGVQVSNITISSPGDSPNTDGIHLQNSKNVFIRNSQLRCGDDCVSIQTGCSNIDIQEVNCGPGHGISIGGLGGDNTKACVSNVTVHDVNLQGTLTGVRIKTWQGGSGTVENIRFSNIQVEEVKIPIVIDQYYCDRSSCKNQSSAVALSNIVYENIKGSFTVKPVHLACSDSVPCTGIILKDLELTPLQEHYHMFDPFCWNAYGQLHPPILPPISCLETKKSMGGQMYVAPVPVSC